MVVLRATRNSDGCRATMTASTITITAREIRIVLSMVNRSECVCGHDPVSRPNGRRLRLEFRTTLLARGACKRTTANSALDQDLESAPEHALAVERHCLGVHHLRQPRILHDFRIDAIAFRARLVDDVGEHDRLSGLELDALRERRVLARLDVVGDALDVFEGAVVAPDLTRLLRHAPIGCQVLLRNGYYISIYVSHKSSIVVSSVCFRRHIEKNGLAASDGSPDHKRLGARCDTIQPM